MVLDWGMSEKLGTIRYGTDEHRMVPDLGHKEYSEATATVVDEEVKKIIDDAYQATRELIEANRDALERVAQALLKYETLSADDVRMILDGKRLDKPTMGDLFEREQQRTPQGADDGVTHTPPTPQPEGPAPPLAEPG
jgi:cell division protease FtsH